MRFDIAILAGLLMCTSAAADVYEDCAKAIRDDDKSATGTEHVYSPTLGKIVPIGEDVEAKKKAEQEKRDEQNWQAALKEVQSIRNDREAKVRRRLRQACDEIYIQNPNEAITNNLCFSVFLETGLPAE